MIAIRADANSQIASGHIIRCLSIADALRRIGSQVVFFTSDDAATDLISERGFESVCLYSDWNDKESELEDFLVAIDNCHPDLLIVDSYQVTKKYLSELHKAVKIAYIDDLNAFDYGVDIVINYSIFAKELAYPQNKKYLLGIKYAPLRSQFDISDTCLRTALEGRRSKKYILLTTGAADPYCVAERTVRELLKETRLVEYNIIVVKGMYWNTTAFSPNNIDSLGQNAVKRVEVFENVSNMAELMIGCSIAVSAGGSTLYELCACCVPTVTFSYADNQLGNVNGFAKYGIMKYAGDARTEKNIQLKILKEVLGYSENGCEDAIQTMKRLPIRGGASFLAESLYRLVS